MQNSILEQAKVAEYEADYMGRAGQVKRKPLTIYKSFIRLHIDYGDILYDKPNNKNFQKKIEKAQCRAWLAITGATQGTPKEKNYDELGLHSPTNGLWHSKLYSYLDFSFEGNYPLRSASSSKLRPFSSRTKSFKNTFFLYCVNEWNNLKAYLRDSIN